MGSKTDGAPRLAGPNIDKARAGDAPEPTSRWKPVAILGLAVIGLTFGVFGTWSAYARLDSAVVAPGTMATSSNIKTVAHLEGGIVAAIHARDGVRVAAGDLLVELDATQTEASVDLFRRQLAAAKAALARSTAEDALADAPEFPVDILASDDPFVKQALAAERQRFNTSRQTLDRNIEVIEAQSEQIEEEVASLGEEQRISQDEAKAVETRLDELKSLEEKSLVRRSEVLDLERDLLTIQGRIAAASSAITRARQRITENALKIVQVRQEYRRVAAESIPALSSEVRELERQIIVSGDMLRRVKILAPVSGVVQEMQVFTVGGVVRPGEPILNIAPDSDSLLVRARISPLDADSVEVGMPAEVQFPAFATLNLLPISGKVVSRSGDRIIDENNGAYFAVDVVVDKDTVPKEISDRLGAGQPASIVIPTGERTALEYLTDPLTKRLSSAMRER